MPKTVIVSGGFDPLHSGHVAYLEAASKLGDRLVVGVNSDAWLIVKKGRFFMPLQERLTVIRAMRCVDIALSFDDKDGTALDLIQEVRNKFPKDEIVFANGGDRTAANIGEMAAPGVQFVFGVGGENKINSSSWLLSNWQAPVTERSWGHYSVLHKADNVKVKELVVEPNMSLSLQRHRHRSEYWYVAEGTAIVRIGSHTQLHFEQSTIEIPRGEWHQLSNPSSSVLRVIEIQYGEICDENDIERNALSLTS